MKIACLQFAPQVGDVSNNIARAEAVLSKADPEDLENLDLLVLPEMAFSGYNFKSVGHISPFLEPTGSGVSSEWARTAARKYGCTVAVGYPERAEASGAESRYYNALIVVDGDGEELANYRKSFLYYTDETWALEGQGFYGGKLGSFGQVAMGICMDINPYKFEAPWNAYEFAFHVLQARANLVILSTAWLTNDERTGFLSSPGAPDLGTLTYWVRRLEPLIRTESPEETIVVFANRCGTENEATYAGTSTVLGIKDGEVSLYGLLGRGVEELLVVDTDKPPFAKIIDPAEKSVDGEPGAPPAPAENPEDSDNGPRRGLGPEAGPGYADSPTLPSGFTPASRTHTASHTTNTTPTASLTTLPTPKHHPTNPTTSSHPNPRTTPKPKLSLLTNLHPAQSHLPPSPQTPPPPQYLPPSARASQAHHHYTWTTSSHPPSAIPIFVDVYTPDADADADADVYVYDDNDDYEAAWHDSSSSLSLLAVDWRNMTAAAAAAAGTTGTTSACAGSDCLSPWSEASASSPRGSCCGRIRIVASPSVFGVASSSDLS